MFPAVQMDRCALEHATTRLRGPNANPLAQLPPGDQREPAPKNGQIHPSIYLAEMMRRFTHSEKICSFKNRNAGDFAFVMRCVERTFAAVSIR